MHELDLGTLTWSRVDTAGVGPPGMLGGPSFTAMPAPGERLFVSGGTSLDGATGARPSLRSVRWFCVPLENVLLKA